MDVKLDAIGPRGKPLAHGPQGVLDRTNPTATMTNYSNRHHESNLSFRARVHLCGEERLQITYAVFERFFIGFQNVRMELDAVDSLGVSALIGYAR
jgi:hypothetical protein